MDAQSQGIDFFPFFEPLLLILLEIAVGVGAISFARAILAPSED